MVNVPNAEMGFKELTFTGGRQVEVLSQLWFCNPAKFSGSMLRNSPWQWHPVAVLLAMLPEAIEAPAVLSQQAARDW